MLQFHYSHFQKLFVHSQERLRLGFLPTKDSERLHEFQPFGACDVKSLGGIKRQRAINRFCRSGLSTRVLLLLLLLYNMNVSGLRLNEKNNN